MKKIILMALPLLALCCTSAPNPFPAEARLFDLGSGAALTRQKAAKAKAVYGTLQAQLFDSPQSVSFVRFKESDFRLEVVAAEGPQADSVSALSLKHGALAGINGSYFDMRQLLPVTCIKDDGFWTGSTTEGEFFRTNGAVLIDPHKISIDAVRADTTWTGPEATWEVMASGPILVDEGMAITYEEGIDGWKGFYARRHPRSLVGMDAQGYVWLVVVDGRSEGNAEGMSIAELTDFALSLGLTDALNLDGGGSSALWVLPEGIVSHPCDNRTFDKKGQRIIPNALVVKEL